MMTNDVHYKLLALVNLHRKIVDSYDGKYVGYIGHNTKPIYTYSTHNDNNCFIKFINKWLKSNDLENYLAVMKGQYCVTDEPGVKLYYKDVNKALEVIAVCKLKGLL